MWQQPRKTDAKNQQASKTSNLSPRSLFYSIISIEPRSKIKKKLPRQLYSLIHNHIPTQCGQMGNSFPIFPSSHLPMYGVNSPYKTATSVLKTTNFLEKELKRKKSPPHSIHLHEGNSVCSVMNVYPPSVTPPSPLPRRPSSGRCEMGWNGGSVFHVRGASFYESKHYWGARDKNLTRANLFLSLLYLYLRPSLVCNLSCSVSDQ